ncbi:MAG: MBL fold metallo-hydrolase [Deltaproteobacteria bacterium]|nr:MBL fold metallo-hydrolase [Deltaproteobacteria bacterium]
MKPWILALASLLAACRPATSAESPHARAPTEPNSAAPGAVAAEPEARFHLIDVGQGAAALLEFPCGAALIDTGGETNFKFDSGRVLRDYLEGFFARRADLARTLDLVVLTHPHLDHTRNVELVVENFTVKHVVTDGDAHGSGGKQQAWLEAWARTNARLETIRSEDVPAGGKSSPVLDPIACRPIDPTIQALWGSVAAAPAGWPERAFRNHNNHSVVIRVGFGKASFIVSGDLEEAGIQSLLERHRPSGALDVDVWQVGHHGSYNATTIPLLEALSPRIALIPMGAPDRWTKWTAWKFGHPRKRAVDMLLGAVSDARAPVNVLVGTSVETFVPQRLERAVYGTGWDGHVVVTALASGSYRVETAHPVNATVGHP